MGRKKIKTEEELKAAERERKRKWYQHNKEKITEKMAEYYQRNKDRFAARNSEYRKNNKEIIAEYKATYRKTPKGRASNLAGSYKQEDKKYGRGECTLTADWIVENIFSQPCHYCGKNGWKELGCDRIDNSLPHTPDNVVPCCCECNKKKGTTPYDDFMKMIGKIA